MLYELQVLRNNEPCKDRYEAISNLDYFKGHLIGQPCCIRYKDGDKVKVLFAIGKKDYMDETYTTPSRDNYELINSFVDNTLYWQKLNDDIDGLVKTQDPFSVVFADFDTWEQARDNDLISPKDVSFVSHDNGIKEIYKGDEVFSTNSLFDLIAPYDYEELGIEEGDDFVTIIHKLKTELASRALVWNTDEAFNLYCAKFGEHQDMIKDLENERSFFEVDLSSKYPEAKVKAHYINEQQIGAAYISKITDKLREMEYNVGDFHVGMTIEDINEMTGMDINTVIDMILFPDFLRLNYGIITKEQILSLFDGSSLPFDPDEEEDVVPDVKPSPEREEHVVISKTDIKDIIDRLDDDYNPSDISGSFVDDHILISKDAIDDIIENLDE